MSIDLMAMLSGEDFVADAQQVDTAVKYAGKIPPGKHKAQVANVKVQDYGNGPVYELEFKIIEGIAQEMKVKTKLYSNVKDTDKDGNPLTPEELKKSVTRAVNQLMSAAFALQLANKITDKNGKPAYKVIKTPLDFRDAIDRFCVIETHISKFTNDKGEEIEMSAVKMFGILPPGEKTGVTATTAAPAKKPVDISDLA